MLGRSADSGKIDLEPVEGFGLKLMSVGFLIGEGQAFRCRPGSCAGPFCRHSSTLGGAGSTF